MYRTRKVRLTKAGRNEALVREVFVRSFLRFVGNDAESYGKPFELEPWVKENIWNPIFGTGRMVGGTFARTRGRPLVVCDPARLQFTVNWLNNNRGIELFKMPQTGAVMCPASELLASAVRLGPAFVLPHLRPEGQERQLGHLEELHAEGRPHHGDAPDGPQEQVAEGHLGATEDEPEAVGQARRQATPVDDLLAERREGERGHLEGLPPHGDAHDRKAPHEAYEQPGQGGDPPAGDDPYNVSQGAHGSSS